MSAIAPTETLKLTHWILETASPEELEKLSAKAQILGLDLNDKRPVQFIHPYQTIGLFQTAENAKGLVKDEMINTGVVAALCLSISLPYLFEPVIDESSDLYRPYMYVSALASVFMSATIVMSLLVLFQINHMIDEEDIVWFISQMMITTLRHKDRYYIQPNLLNFLYLRRVSYSDGTQASLQCGILGLWLSILIFLQEALEVVDFWIIATVFLGIGIFLFISVLSINNKKTDKIVEDYNEFLISFGKRRKEDVLHDDTAVNSMHQTTNVSS